MPYSVTPTTVTTANQGVDVTVHWDVSNCVSTNYHLIYGKGENLSAWTVDGGKCAIGTSGTYGWTGVPDPGGYSSRFLWFLVVGDNGATTEGSWGLYLGGCRARRHERERRLQHEREGHLGDLRNALRPSPSNREGPGAIPAPFF